MPYVMVVVGTTHGDGATVATKKLVLWEVWIWRRVVIRVVVLAVVVAMVVMVVLLA